MTISRTPPEMSAAVIKCLMIGPGSRKTLAAQMNVPLRKSMLLNKYLDAYLDAGIIYVSGWTELKRPIFALQPSLFEHENAEKPANKYPPRRRRPEQREAKRAHMQDYRQIERQAVREAGL